MFFHYTIERESGHLSSGNQNRGGVPSFVFLLTANLVDVLVMPEADTALQLSINNMHINGIKDVLKNGKWFVDPMLPAKRIFDPPINKIVGKEGRRLGMLNICFMHHEHAYISGSRQQRYIYFVRPWVHNSNNLSLTSLPEPNHVRTP